MNLGKSLNVKTAINLEGLPESTLKRILKAAGLTWKRIRNTMTDRRNEDEFKATQQSNSEYRTLHEESQIEIMVF